MKQIALLISGRGSNAHTLIKAARNHRLPCCINKVIADRDCHGKTYAFEYDIPFVLIDYKMDKTRFIESLIQAIPKNTDFIVLAGFLSIVPDVLLAAFPNKVINIHPSLLPKFGGIGMHGIHVHKAVIAAGETESGCSVHYVTPTIDGGEVIAQAKVAVSKDDTPEILQKRVIAQEHQLLLSTIAKLLG